MEAIMQLFDRDLNKLLVEIDGFTIEENLWITEGNVINSAGNLCLHIVGNLNHFIGAIIGENGYIRKREMEFSNKNIPIGELKRLISETIIIVNKSLQSFIESKLKSTYPIQVFGEDMTYEYFLIHLVAHLNYHLGQINYLRRILEP